MDMRICDRIQLTCMRVYFLNHTHTVQSVHTTFFNHRYEHAFDVTSISMVLHIRISGIYVCSKRQRHNTYIVPQAATAAAVALYVTG